VIIKNPQDIESIRTAGKYLAEVLSDLQAKVKPGISTAELDVAAEEGIVSRGCTPAFLGYKPQGMKYPFPAVLCISVNDEVVHGIPKANHILKDGDVVSLDLGLSYKGFFVDSAVTMCVGEGDDSAKKLINATREALSVGIGAARVGGTMGGIGEAVESVAQRNKVSVVEDLGGHAIGKKLHEQPFIPNAGHAGEGEHIVEGMALAIEPMFCEGSPKIILDEDDQWTYRMQDGKRAAHFEHTVLVTKDGPEILTKV
jgi:methionyl aminopeptidase